MPVNNLSPWQLFIQSKAGSGKNVSFTDEQLRQWADEFFGAYPIPPGSQIIRQDGGYIEFIDPQGYKHTATRSLDGRDPNAGRWRENTDRPPGTPTDPAAAEALKQQQSAQNELLNLMREITGAQGANAAALARGERPAGLDPGIQKYLDQITGVTDQLRGAPTLAGLDPQTLALLDQISAAEQARLNQQFQDAQGTAIAQLYGNRTNQSSMGNEAIARLIQSQGLVNQQQAADAAARRIGAQQFLTQQGQGNLQLALQGLLGAADAQLGGFKASNTASQDQVNALNDLLKTFTGFQTQRDLLGATLGQQQKELEENARQANLNFELAQQKADMELAATRNQFLKTLGGSILGAGLGILSGGLAPGGIFRGGTASAGG